MDWDPPSELTSCLLPDVTVERPTKVQSNNLWPLLIWRLQIRFLVWLIFGTSISCCCATYMIDDGCPRLQASSLWLCSPGGGGGFGRGWALGVNRTPPANRRPATPCPSANLHHFQPRRVRSHIQESNNSVTACLISTSNSRATLFRQTAIPLPLRPSDLVSLDPRRTYPPKFCPPSLPTILPNDPLRSEQRKNLPPIHPRRA